MGVLGQALTVGVSSTVANLGPDGPVDADLTQTAIGSAGVTVTPASRAIDVDELAVGTPATVSGSYSVTCTAPGAQLVTVISAVVPEKSKVVDLVATNNSKAATFAIDCAVPVTINIKPGSLTNPVNPAESNIPIGVLTTRAGEYGNPLAFNSTTIQPLTIRLGTRTTLVATNTGAPEVHRKIHPENVFELNESTRDTDTDVIVHFDSPAVPVTVGTTELCVRGRFGPGGGKTFFGCDRMLTVPK